MSQYLKIEVKVQRIEAVAAALKKLGLAYEIDPRGQLELESWLGNRWGRSNNKCHIRVRRDNLGTSCADFGANLDTGEIFMCDNTVQGKMKPFLQEYAVAAATLAYEDQGRYVYRQDDAETGQVHLYIQGS